MTAGAQSSFVSRVVDALHRLVGGLPVALQLNIAGFLVRRLIDLPGDLGIMPENRGQ